MAAVSKVRVGGLCSVRGVSDGPGDHGALLRLVIGSEPENLFFFSRRGAKETQSPQREMIREGRILSRRRNDELEK